MTLKPLKDRLVLREMARPSETPGGIFVGHLPSDQLQSQFKVLGVGPKQRECRVGDTVLCNTYAGTKLTVDGLPARIVEGASIIAILERVV